MSADPPASPRPTARPWWLAPAAGAALAVAAGAVYWACRESPADPVVSGPPGPVSPARVLPPPPADGQAGLHSVTVGVENGVRVLKIRVTPGGDELIVDAATGRLLETRPGRAPAGPGVKPMAQAP